jgi:hypothetical protein
MVWREASGVFRLIFGVYMRDGSESLNKVRELRAPPSLTGRGCFARVFPCWTRCERAELQKLTLPFHALPEEG